MGAFSDIAKTADFEYLMGLFMGDSPVFLEELLRLLKQLPFEERKHIIDLVTTQYAADISAKDFQTQKSASRPEECPARSMISTIKG